MRNWSKIVFLVVVALLVTSCGTPNPNQKHIDSLSMLPKFVVSKSGETKNSVTLFSFDMEEIRKNISWDETKPHSALVNNLGLVVSRYYDKNEEIGLLNPTSIELLASCPYWNIQAFSPADDLGKKISEAGYIEEIIGDGYFYTKDFKDSYEVDSAPVNCIINNTVVQSTTTAKVQKEVVMLMLMGNTDRAGDYEALTELFNHMPEHQAVAVVFSFDRFGKMAEGGAILGFYDKRQQIDLIPKFQMWGRPENYIFGAVGSSVADGIEHSTMVLLYGDEDTAKDDLITIEKALHILPSTVDGSPWMQHMHFGKPIIKQKGKAIILDFDIEDRDKDDGLFSMQMLKFMDQTGDWGLFWRK